MNRGSKKTNVVVGEPFSVMLQELVEERKQLDAKFHKLLKRLPKELAKEARKITPNGHKIYVRRRSNASTLLQAIPQAMMLGRKMRTEDIIDRLRTKKLYESDSDYFYAMVNGKLRMLSEDPKIPLENPDRGVYVLRARQAV